MSGFLKRTVQTVNPAGGVNPALSPNVTQYGWTSFDAGNANQLIEYVNISNQNLITMDEKIVYVEKLINDFQVEQGLVTSVNGEVGDVVLGSENIKESSGKSVQEVLDQLQQFNPEDLSKRSFDKIDVRDFGAKGDGITDDSAAFQAADASNHSTIMVSDGTYNIGSYIPTKKYFGPGLLKITNGNIRKLDKVPQGVDYTKPNTVLGASVSELGTFNTLMGYNVGGNFGPEAKQNCLFGHNLGSGDTIYPETNQPFTGVDNNGFGYHALKKNQSGRSNNAFGGDALNENKTGNHNCAFGQAAGQQIVTQSDGCFFGSAAGGRADSGNGRTALFGRDAGRENRNTSNNALFGWGCGRGITIPAKTFTGDGVTKVFDYVGFIFTGNKEVRIDIDGVNTLPTQYSVSGVDGKVTFITAPANGSSIVMTSTIGSSNYTGMSAIGARALMGIKTGSDSVVVGTSAAENTESITDSVVIGMDSCINSTTISGSIIIGKDAGKGVADVSNKLIISNHGSLPFVEGGMNGARDPGNRLTVDCAIRPASDDTRALGSPSNRWSVVFSANGAIQTSDARMKTSPMTITDDVLNAWGDVQFITFQWLDSIRIKGEGTARTHYGVMAQQVRDAFAARGIDGTRFGLLCYDEWEEDGTKHNRWGIRPDQCLFLEAAYQRRRCDRIESRLNKAGV